MIRPALALALSLALAGPAAAQVDTAASDAPARDTLPALLAAFPEAIPPGPLPAGARRTFTADSLLFSNIRTLSDLLGHLPGVFVARGGWFGQAEPVIYGGRGPLALEVYWDGVPYKPAGRDSIWLDPARISLAPLARVDVVILPAALRVYLVTTEHRSSAARTEIGVLTGDLDITGYRVGYAARSRGGVGLALLADWNNLDGGAATSTSSFSSTEFWLKGDYVAPGGRLGASVQFLTSAWRRDGATGLVDPWRVERRDLTARGFLAERTDGLGFRLVGAISRTTTDRDSAVARRTLYQASLEGSRTWARANVTVTGRVGTHGWPTEIEARAGWMPVPWVTVAGWARHAAYEPGRTGRRAHVTAGVALPLGFSARGEWAWLDDVQAPLISADTARQEATDVAAWIRWEHRLAVLEVGRGTRDPFVPLGFAAGILSVARLDSTPRTEFVAAHAAVRPLPGVTLSGWYFDAVVGGGSFEPPTHARISATFSSKFWRVFRSGVFALRGEVAVESWSRWFLAGRDSLGALGLNGATYVETNLQLQLVGATFFWVIRNSNGMRGAPAVPNLRHPKSVQLYGVRWHFAN